MRGPNGKHLFGLVKVGPKGQIVIPVEARNIFGIKPGDSLMLIGDEESGLAVITEAHLSKSLQEILEKREGEVL